ncbi:2-haloacid dehalogenase [Nitrobacteraceae bacterium AZCC 2146]
MPVSQRYDAVVFDLLTALLNSWKLWNSAAGSEDAGLRWRKTYLGLTYDCGPYRPYEDLVRAAAEAAGLPQTAPEALVTRWSGLEPWNDVGEVVSELASRVPLGIATNCSIAMTGAAVSAVGVKFAAVSCAEEVGYYKPRPEPYLAVLKKLGTDPARTLFVAGSSADVPGATGVGMPVFWHNRAGLTFTSDKARPMIVSDTLRPLLDLV